MFNFSPIPETYIRSLATEQSFDRGYRYYQNDSVFNVTQRGNLVSANVHGSDYEPYHIEITLDNEHQIALTSCTCPYDWGGICKHIVTTLLVISRDQETIVQKPGIEALIADLTPGQLRQILVGLAEAEPQILDAIEREVNWLPDQEAMPAENKSSSLPLLVNDIRRQMDKDFRQAGKGSTYHNSFYDEYLELEVDPFEILDPHLAEVFGLLEKGDSSSAEILISTIIEAFIEGLATLHEWVYEYNLDIFDEAVMSLDTAVAEVLLSQELTKDQEKKWLDKVANWEEGLGEMVITKTAIEQGWRYPPLVAAMQGNITEMGAWEGDAPHYADDLAKVRLRILARQNRQEEYINLAEAEGQVGLAINMLARSGDIDKAISKAKNYLHNAAAFLSLARIVDEKGEQDAALELAVFGLSQDSLFGQEELVLWIREKLTTFKKQPLALNAALSVFSTTHELVDYLAVQQLAGDKWPTIQPQLLKDLQKSDATTNKIDIYLFENMPVEAMQSLDKEGFLSDYDLQRVIEITKDSHPDWGIRKCKNRAEAIMDAGRSGDYESAVYWLAIARDIYQQHNRQKEWEKYLDSLLEIHHRKYKLVPMLGSIRQ